MRTDRLQRLGLCAQRFKDSARHPHACALIVASPDLNEPMRFVVRERSQQHGIEQAEQRRGCPDTDGQRDDTQRREPWAARECAGGKSKIGEQVAHDRSSDRVTDRTKAFSARPALFWLTTCERYTPRRRIDGRVHRYYSYQ